MRPERDIPNLDDLVSRYLSGVPVTHLAKELGMGPPVLARRFRLNGVHLRGRAEARRLNTDIPAEVRETAIHLYRSGQTIKQAAASTGLTMDQLYNLLKREGIERRGSSEIRTTEWAALSPEQRSERAKKFMDRVAPARSMPKTMESRIARSATNQLLVSHRGAFENELSAELRSRDVMVIQQRAIGPYNVDLAIEESRIAVEIERPKGPSHPAMMCAAERTKYILYDGWALLFCFLRSVRQVIDVVAVADDVVAVAQKLRGDKSPIGKYGVIGGKRQLPPGLGSKLKDLPRIPGA